MVVILTEQQVLSTKQVCSSCLMADSGGLPRWRKGKLCCGHLVENSISDRLETSPHRDRPKIYECEMGFRVTNIK